MRRSFLIPMLCVTAGCVVRAPGVQDLPAEAVARLSFTRSSPDIQIMAASLNGTPMPTLQGTSEVAPGEYKFSVSYSVSVAELCDGLQRLCPTTSVRGVCDGIVSLGAGEDAVVSLDVSGGEMRAYVRPPWTLRDLFSEPAGGRKRLECIQSDRLEGSTRSAV